MAEKKPPPKVVQAMDELTVALRKVWRASCCEMLLLLVLLVLLLLLALLMPVLLRPHSCCHSCRCC